MLSSLNLGEKTQKYFVSSSNMFLDKKTFLKIWLNLGLKLTIFRGTGAQLRLLCMRGTYVATGSRGVSCE